MQRIEKNLMWDVLPATALKGTLNLEINISTAFRQRYCVT